MKHFLSLCGREIDDDVVGTVNGYCRVRDMGGSAVEEVGMIGMVIG